MKQGALLFLVLGVSACWVPLDRGRQMESRIQRLEGESNLAAQHIEEQRAILRERVVEVDKKIEELNAGAHRTGADLAVNQDKLLEQVARLRGVIEEQAHKLDQLEQDLAAAKGDVEERFAALKGAGALDELEAKKKLQVLKRPMDKGEFFALAQAQEAKGERAVARDLYQEYAKRWPADARAPNARFRVGELLFADRRYREAILEYGKIVQESPGADVAPDALERTGESMLALDLKDDAVGLFREVVKRYPRAIAAKRAQGKLQELAPAVGKGSTGKKKPTKRKE